MGIKEVITLGIWALLWFFGWAGFFAGRRIKIDYIQRFQFATLWFLLVTTLNISIYPEVGYKWLHDLSKAPWILGILAIVIAIVYVVVPRSYPRPQLWISQHPYEQFLCFSWRYVLTKTCEIAFQQSLIIALIFILRENGLSILATGIAFSLLFGVAHIYMFFKNGIFFGAFYATGAGLSGLLFPWLILECPSGSMLSFAIHWAFYLVSGWFFWHWSHKKQVFIS